MGIIQKIRRWAGRVYGWIYEKLISTAQKDFDITPLTAPEVDAVISDCGRAYNGTPTWLDGEEGITTVNFAAVICEEVARLTTLAIGIALEGSARATWLQEQIDGIYFQLRHWVEYACAYGTVILKVDATGAVTCMIPGCFLPTEQDKGRITGAVFKDETKQGKEYYTRLEYHRFEKYMEDGEEKKRYLVSNVAYRSSSEDVIGEKIPLEDSPWSDFLPEVAMNDIEEPLFAVLRMPNANNVEINSPYGLPIFSGAMEELKALDFAYSRNAKEIYDSKRTVIVDSDKLFISGMPITQMGEMDERVKQFGLPDFVKAVSTGSSNEPLYQEINPTLNTDMRITGINHLLSQIGYKCGFSNGYFVMDEKTGMMTATQVESDDRRTIQMIKDVRDKLEDCLDSLLYAMDAFATLYELAPEGPYEVTYDFGDIDYNLEEDRARWWGYVQASKVPAWMYFVRFEGMTEEEAKKMTKEAEPEQPELFSRGMM